MLEGQQVQVWRPPSVTSGHKTLYQSGKVGIAIKMDAEQTPAIDVEKIRQQIALFDDGVRDHLSDGAVLVVGTTRSGKSTVMNILAGKEIEVEKINGRARINVVGKEYAGIITATGFEPMKIVHGSDSGTKLPNYFEVNGDHYWDCPGSFDNRGVDTEISNCYFVHRLLHKATEPNKKGVKFVLVQDYPGLSVEGGKSFTDMIETICTIFQPESSDDINNLIDATTFVFNKVDRDDLPNEENSSEDFIANVIKEVSTTMTEEEIEKLPSKKRARIAFINQMAIKVKDLRFVAVPAARLSYSVNVLKGPILDPASGLVQKVESCRPISNQKPKLAVSDECLNAVLLILREYEGLLTTSCSELQVLLQEYFVSLGLERTLTFVDDNVFPFLKENKASVACGGANRVSLKLVQRLEDTVKDDEVTSFLKNMKHLIDKMSFFDLLIRNARCGFDFTKLISAVRMAAAKFLSMEHQKALEEYEKKLRAYINEQNHLSNIKKVFGAPVWLVTAIVHAATWIVTKPLSLLEQKMKNVNEEELQIAKLPKATKEALHHCQGKVYGYMDKPNSEEFDKKRKKIQEEMKKLEGE